MVRTAKKQVNNKQKSWTDAQQHLQFFANDGQVIRNIRELPKALQKMNAQTFAYHVSKEKNDFANWVENVFKEKKLADDIRSRKTKTGIVRIIQRQF